MLFKEYGDKNKQALILIHAGGLNDWMFFKHIKSLKSHYFLIVPILDGHADDAKEFISIESSANNLLEYLKEHHSNKDFYIYGISLGAQIALQMISTCSDLFPKAIIESCLLYPQKTMLKAMLPSISLTYPLVSKEWFSKIQAKALYIPDNLFYRYYNDSKNISKDNLINITKSNMMFDIPIKNNITTQVLVVYGSKEINVMKKSASSINNILSNCNIKVLADSHHAQMLFSNPNKHMAYISKFFSE